MSQKSLFLLMCLAPLAAFAQDVVKVNILELAGKIPAPPANVREAYARSACQEDSMFVGAVHCNVDKTYKPVTDKLDATGKQIEQAAAVLAKPSMDAAKGMDSKEMRKKIKSMSREEQIKLAMEMSKNMGMNSAPAPESDAVMDAREELIKVNEQLGRDVQNASPVYQRREKLMEDREAKHKEIEDWRQAEAPKLPQINTGEMSVAEPKALHALLVKVMDKHLAVENDHLKAIQKEWSEAWENYRKVYGTMQTKLVAIHYGEDAKNAATKQQFLTVQGNMVAGTKDLVALSRDATQQAAEWWGQKLVLDREKPKK